MREIIEKELASLPDNFIIGLIVKADNYEEANLYMLDILMKKHGHIGSYVTVNRPYESILPYLKKNSVDTDKLFFIDCITKHANSKVPKTNNCIFLDSPSNLTDIAIALHEYVIATKNNKKFLVLDSLSTLSIHNEPMAMMKFLHYLTAKMRLWSLNGIMITLHEETDRRLISELAQFCDKMIRL